jgi:hypothetical protein
VFGLLMVMCAPAYSSQDGVLTVGDWLLPTVDNPRATASLRRIVMLIGDSTLLMRINPSAFA